MQAPSFLDEQLDIDPHELAASEVLAMGEEIAELAAHIDCATHALLTRIRAFDRAGGWHQAVRVAHRLAELPLIDEAFAKGQLSYSKVRAMVRVATEENEEQLLMMAEQTTAAQLDKICRLKRSVDRLSEPENGKPAERALVQRDTDDGMVAVTLRLLPDEAARFVKAAEVCADSEALIDGAMHMADEALAQPQGEVPVRPAVEAVVHVSAEGLTGHTEDGQGLSVETCRRLLCDSGIVPMLEDERGRTLDVGRKTRVVSAPLRRALAHRENQTIGQVPGWDGLPIDYRACVDSLG